MKNNEANRCLQCKNARCQAACPVHTDVPTIMGLYKEEKMEEAGRILFENNPLSAVTSIVCDWCAQCYGHCILGIKGEPVRFYEIEQEVSGKYLFDFEPEQVPLNGKKVAIIGAGPAGITSAICLAKKGYAVTIYEAQEKIGGVLRYGIPAFRLPKNLVDQYEVILKKYNVQIKPNTLVGPVIPVQRLLDDGYNAVFVGIGVGDAKPINIPGDTNAHIHYAIDYLRAPEAYDLGKKVIIIGGGNVAMDAARTALRKGYDTTIYYRKTFENMPASKIEIEEAKEDGVKFEVFEAPVSFKDGCMTFVKCENVVDENGKTQTKTIEGTEHDVEVDSVIVAVSQTTNKNLFTTSSITLNKRDLIEVNEQYETSIPGVFAAGDVVSGAKTVVEAVEGGKKAAEYIDAYCQSK